MAKREERMVVNGLLAYGRAQAESDSWGPQQFPRIPIFPLSFEDGGHKYEAVDSEDFDDYGPLHQRCVFCGIDLDLPHENPNWLDSFYACPKNPVNA